MLKPQPLLWLYWTSKEIIKVYEVRRMRPWSNRISVLIIRRDTRALTLFLYHPPLCTCPEERIIWGHSEKVSTSQEEGSHQKPNLLAPGSWISSVENWENKFLLFRLPSLWYFVIAYWEDWYHWLFYLCIVF